MLTGLTDSLRTYLTRTSYMLGDGDLIPHPHSVQDGVLQSGYLVVAIVSCAAHGAPTLCTAADPTAFAQLITSPRGAVCEQVGGVLIALS